MNLKNALSVGIMLTLWAPGCILADDVLDFPFDLPQKEFQVDTGEIDIPSDTGISCTPGTCAAMSPDLQCNAGTGSCEVIDNTVVPTIACDAVNDPCGQLAGSGLVCNIPTGSCMVRQGFELVSAVNLSTEVPEFQDVGSSGLAQVRFDYIRMFVIENTFTVDTPEIQIYLAPQTVATLFDTSFDPPVLFPDVVLLGTLPPILAQTSGMSQDVVVDPAGEAQLNEYCRTPDIPFNLFAYSVIELLAGDPIPQGLLRVRVDARAVASPSL